MLNKRIKTLKIIYIKVHYLAIKQLYFVIMMLVKSKHNKHKINDKQRIKELELQLKKNAHELNKCKAELKQRDEKIEQLEKRIDQATEAYNRVLQHFKDFQRQRFGQKSERFIDNAAVQGDLFGDGGKQQKNKNSDDSSANEDEFITVPEHKRRTHKGFPKHLPRREVIIKAEDDICSCGKKKRLVRYIITEILNIIPAVYEVIVQKREVLGCSCGCAGSISTAANPKRILPKVMVTESTLADIIISKFHDRQPLYHQEKKLESRFGVELSRDNQSRWVIGVAQKLQPLINLMQDQIYDYDVASTDATGIQVLKEPGRKPQDKSYIYCVRGGSPGKKVAVYDYNPQDHKAFLKIWFEIYRGYLHVDGENIFDELGKTPNISLVYCNSHARRKFEKIAKSAQKEGLATEALRYYKKLYKIEREIKKLNLTPAQAWIYRQNKAKPILDDFKKWLDKNYPTVLPESPLGKAFYYTLRHWPGLIRYLDDGRLEIDNNLTEQKIKPVVIARKNFLFADTVAGADAICVHMTLIQTALLHGFDPFHYYVAIMKAIPYCETVEDYEKLLPWNIDLPKVRFAENEPEETAEIQEKRQACA